MSGDSINLNDKKILKNDVYNNKKIFNIDDIDANKILVSKKSLRLSQMTGYIGTFDENKNNNNNNVC